MADYALLMVHNPYSSDTSKKGLEVVEVMRKSILTILSKRTGQDIESLAAQMDEETWFTAEQALTLGFATSVEATEAMIQLEPAAQSVEAMFSVCNSVLSKAAPVDSAPAPEGKESQEHQEGPQETPQAPQDSESSAVDAPEAPEVVEYNESTISEALKEADEEKQELVRVNAELLSKLAALEATVNSYQKEAAVKAQAEKDAASAELVTNAILAGKIKADAKAHWLNMATANFDNTKAALESINVVNKVNPGIMSNAKDSTNEKPATYRELDRNNPKELARLMQDEPAVYNQLFFEQFGKYPQV
jgi:hypothetical protein